MQWIRSRPNFQKLTEIVSKTQGSEPRGPEAGESHGTQTGTKKFANRCHRLFECDLWSTFRRWIEGVFHTWVSFFPFL